VVDMPQSDAIFLKAYLAETAEASCDGHVAAFDFFGGVPRSILYDNTKLAIARILGGEPPRRHAFETDGEHARVQRDVLDAAVPLPVQGPLRPARQGQLFHPG